MEKAGSYSSEIPWEKVGVLADPTVRRIIYVLRKNYSRWSESQKKLAKAAEIPLSTLNKKLQKMEEVGLIEREELKEEEGETKIKLIELIDFKITLNADIIYYEEEMKERKKRTRKEGGE